MDILRLYQDYHIKHQTEGHKHCHPGWVHTACPFCEGNPGLHLGYNFEGKNFVCWRCGGHRTVETLEALLNLPKKDVFPIMRKYSLQLSKVPEKKIKIQRPLILPSGVSALQQQHKQYLKKRGFDWQQLERDWKIQGTGPVSRMDNQNFAHRIFIPIFWDDKLVSFQGRDITDKSPYKYLACPDEMQIINLKTILYRQTETGRHGICVEGVTDVWNLGFDAFGTFGIKWKMKQVKEIQRLYNRVTIIYDGEVQAQQKARELEAELKFRGIACSNIVLPNGKDPGSLSAAERDSLLKSIL